MMLGFGLIVEGDSYFKWAQVSTWIWKSIHLTPLNTCYGSRNLPGKAGGGLLGTRPTENRAGTQDDFFDYHKDKVSHVQGSSFAKAKRLDCLLLILRRPRFIA